MPIEESPCTIDSVGMKGEQAPVAPRERFQTVWSDRSPDPEPEQSASHGTRRAGHDDADKAELSSSRRKAGERHDQLGGNGRE